MDEHPLNDEYDGPRLFFTMGPARCGKSTYCRSWQLGEAMPQLPLTHRVVWNSDSLRLAMGGQRFTRTLEPQIHTFKIYAIKTLLLSGHTVLVDGTHTTSSSIQDLLRIDIDAVPIVFDTPKDECIRRAHATDQSDLVPVIERHCDQLASLLNDDVDVVMSILRSYVKDYDEYRWSKPCPS